MDPSYGWAADDPRWTDANAGGRGRLEPEPPPAASFSDADTAVGAVPPITAGRAPDEAVTELLPRWPTPPPNGAPFHTQFSTGYGSTATPGTPAIDRRR